MFRRLQTGVPNINIIFDSFLGHFLIKKYDFSKKEPQKHTFQLKIVRLLGKLNGLVLGFDFVQYRNNLDYPRPKMIIFTSLVIFS